jgi:hypothetical protein
MPLRTVLTVLLGFALGCLIGFVTAGPASAYAPFQMGIHEPEAESVDDGRWDAIRDANAGLSRITLYWARVTPSGKEKPAGFDARDPADPNYNWDVIDNFVRGMAARDVEPFITTLEAPPWAEGDDAADRSRRTGDAGTYRVNAKEFGDFMHAVATRYSGSFEDETGRTLPRVRYFQMWNEPNFGQYLVSRRQEDIPRVYVNLLNAGYDAVKDVSRSNVVLTAGLGPYGNNGHATDVDPQVFMRSMMCLMGEGGRKLRVQRRCRTPRPKFDIWTQHPYTFGGTPRTEGGSPDSAAIGNMADIRRTLGFAVRKGVVAPRGRKKMWVSEFGWFANPPGLMGQGKQLGLPPAKHAAYLSETAYRLWKQRFEALVWYGLHDQSHPFPSGLYQGRFPNATPRPALTAFRFPFYADHNRRGVLAWGLVSRGGRSSVRIERRAGRRWRPVTTLRTDARGMFNRRVRARKGTYRARVVSGSKSGLVSRPFRAR